MNQVFLEHSQIEQKINRLAYQILENIFEEKHVLIGGIKGNGLVLAEKLHPIIQAEFEHNLEFFSIAINKDSPLSDEPQISIAEEKFKNACVILVDDVLNSGRTMQYALMKILEQPVHILKTVALVDRKHRRYPVKADFVGVSLSTTLQNHVAVSFEKNNYQAILHE